MDTHVPIELFKTLAGLDVQWKPQIVGQFDDYVVRVARVQGDHFWHAHDNTDELFMVLDGELRLGLRDKAGEHLLTLSKGAMYIVPRHLEHLPFSPDGADILLIANKQLSRPRA